tara:strand:+ start:1177 stop:2847 length:1671 start_codon:yes stop_codon:yes gene_type:complete
MTFKSNLNPVFRNKFAEDIFNLKYRHKEGCNTWDELCTTLVHEVCNGLMEKDEISDLISYMQEMKFIAGGRYLYYAGRELKYYNNCYLLRAEEDTREDWANIAWKATSCLMSGGGIGIDYSVYRPSGSYLKRTGGIASGALPAMEMINNIGRQVMQGGSRRSAIYASLDHDHGDIEEFQIMKNWYDMEIGDTNYGKLKEENFNFPAPMDYTNISVNYKTKWFNNYFQTGKLDDTFLTNVRQAMSTSEAGFSFNYLKDTETLRNACTEVTSSDDSDLCNLGSLNLSKIENIKELEAVTELATKFLICGTIRGQVPYKKIEQVREKNRRIGLGLMGVHEWQLQRGFKYEINEELRNWLQIYQNVSDETSESFAYSKSISKPVANRAIAPTGTIGILAGTTTGIEPLFAVAYKRRYLKDGHDWTFQYVVDSSADTIMKEYGVSDNDIESALDLSDDPERRIQFQADVQDYVDMGISSTINLPSWGSDMNNENKVESMAKMIAKYAHRLRGLTFYADGSRGGQPLTPVSYSDVIDKVGIEYKEEAHDICDISGKGGTCGV